MLKARFKIGCNIEEIVLMKSKKLRLLKHCLLQSQFLVIFENDLLQHSQNQNSSIFSISYSNMLLGLFEPALDRAYHPTSTSASLPQKAIPTLIISVTP